MHNPTRITDVRQGSPRADHPVVRWTLIALAVLIVGVLVIIPVANVFTQAFSGGWQTYWKSLVADRDTRHAILLTLIVAPISVVMNTIFGVAAAWAIARFRFPGRTVVTTLIDLPFSVSPVVAGLSLVLIFGLQGYLGPWLREHHIKVIFAIPGLILATTFVTLPFVARELIPVMEAIGAEEEIAAVSLGANPWQTFWYVTVPNIKWGLLYGVVLCNARAMGEFGAVYVVSGHIAGRTDTMPLRVEKLFQEYNTPGSFSVASLLTMLALVTLVAKVALERKTRAELRDAAAVARGDGPAEPVVSGSSAGSFVEQVSPPSHGAQATALAGNTVMAMSATAAGSLARVEAIGATTHRAANPRGLHLIELRPHVGRPAVSVSVTAARKESPR